MHHWWIFSKYDQWCTSHCVSQTIKQTLFPNNLKPKKLYACTIPFSVMKNQSAVSESLCLTLLSYKYVFWPISIMWMCPKRAMTGITLWTFVYFRSVSIMRYLGLLCMKERQMEPTHHASTHLIKVDNITDTQLGHYSPQWLLSNFHTHTQACLLSLIVMCSHSVAVNRKHLWQAHSWRIRGYASLHSCYLCSKNHFVGKVHLWPQGCTDK